MSNVYAGTEQSNASHPPDVPNHSEARYDSEKCSHKAGRIVLGYFYRRVVTPLHWPVLPRPHPLFFCPERVDFADARQHRKIPGRRRRRCSPLKSTAIPWIAGRVAKLVALANRHHKLDDLTDNSSQNDHRAGLSDP